MVEIVFSTIFSNVWFIDRQHQDYLKVCKLSKSEPGGHQDNVTYARLNLDG